MKIHNVLPHFIDCLKKWSTLPSEKDFNELYIGPIDSLLRPMLEDFGSFRDYTMYEFIRTEVNWEKFRTQALTLQPTHEETRVAKILKDVEALLGCPLEGEIVLFGAFTMMDGYARFERGTHRVYLGVDEDHADDAYLKILISHELTHVARESKAPVWEGWGLDPKMTHDQLTKCMPVIEHLFSEGYSCVTSEVLNPGHHPSRYVYQSLETYAEVMKNSDSLDDRIHQELCDPNGYYRNLYWSDKYPVPVPRFSHYVWAWQWVKQLVEKHGHSDPKSLLSCCSKDFLADALAFRLGK